MGFLFSPDNSAIRGKEGSLPVDPSKAREIIAKNFLPPIDNYKLILSQDVTDAASDLELGKVNKENLGQAKKDLEVLKNLLNSYCQRPQDFYLRERRDSYDDEHHLTLILAPKRKERLLPTEKEKAVNELVIDLRLPSTQESRESLTEAESLGRSAEKAFMNIERKTPPYLRLIFRTNSAYFDEQIRKIKVDWGAGVSIDCRQDEVVARGIYYVGRTPHETDPWPEKMIQKSSCIAVANFLTSDNFYARR